MVIEPGVISSNGVQHIKQCRIKAGAGGGELTGVSVPHHTAEAGVVVTVALEAVVRIAVEIDDVAGIRDDKQHAIVIEG